MPRQADRVIKSNISGFKNNSEEYTSYITDYSNNNLLTLYT